MAAVATGQPTLAPDDEIAALHHPKGVTALATDRRAHGAGNCVSSICISRSMCIC